MDYEVYVDPAAAQVEHERRLLEQIIKELQAALRRVPAVQASADAVVSAVADRASRLVTVQGESKMKYSYHVVFPNILFNDAAAMKAFLPLIQGVDRSVYTTKQAFGMPWSGKPSSSSPYVQREPWNLARYDGKGSCDTADTRFAWLQDMIIEVPLSRANSLLESKTAVLVQTESAAVGPNQPQQNAGVITAPGRPGQPSVGLLRYKSYYYYIYYSM